MASGTFEDDEVEAAVKEAQKRLKAVKARGGFVPGGRILPPVKSPPRPREAMAAAEAFKAVADGRVPPYTTTIGSSGMTITVGGLAKTWAPAPQNNSRVTPERALAIIVDHIQGAGGDEEVRRVASEWITRITNSIYDVIRELSEPE